jgi:flagellar biosynthesis GTPase FlhF
MSDSEKIVQLHSPTPEVSSEERARRLGVEVERLARLPPFEWRLYLDETAKWHEVAPTKWKEMIEATIKANEKKAREAKADDRREKRRVERKQERDDKLTRQEEERKRKQDERDRKEIERVEREEEARRKKREAAFAEIAELPRLTHETRLKEAAKRLGEDFETLFEEFEVYFAARSIPKELEPWVEPVDIAELLAEIEVKFRRYVVVSDAIAAATALWVPFTYVVEIAVHAPKLLFHFPEKDAGKTTALGALRHMIQRPYAAVEATGAAVYRIVDRLKPTLTIDEADKLFQRNTMLAHIINASWTNDKRMIPRVGPGGVVVEYDPYGTQAISTKGLNMPDTTLSRCIVCMLWPKLPTEVVEDFDYVDDEEFRTIRRKLTRWTMDNAAALRDANPKPAPGFNNRIRLNWRTLLAIADLAGGGWSERARAAALELREEDSSEPTDGIKALAAMEQLLRDREEITSAEVCKALIADPTSEWCNFRGNGPISQAQLAALYKPYRIRPVKLHPTGRSSLGRNGYRREQFKQAFVRLLQKPIRDPDTRTQSRAKRRNPRKK